MTPAPSVRLRAGSGVGWMLFTAGCFATSDATAKHLGATIPILILLWSRYVFQTAVMGSMQWRRRGWRDLFKSGHPPLQAIRAALLVANATCAFAALQVLPLAEYTALVMVAPMFSTLLAATLLRERVTPTRWALVGLGFAGMLLIVRPGATHLGWPVLLPIAGALFYAFFQIVTNRLAEVDDSVTTNLLSGTGALLILCIALAVLPVDAVTVLGAADRHTWLLIAALGTAATLGQMSMTLALRAAPLSRLTPFAYVQIAFAAFLGRLLFSHSPDLWTAGGMGLIALSGALTVVVGARESVRES